jgi:hypothetical protein
MTSAVVPDDGMVRLGERRTVTPSVKEGPAGFCRADPVASEHQFFDLARAA